LTTPCGNPTLSHKWAKYNVDHGVYSDGLITTVYVNPNRTFPASKAGTIFHVKITD
jgi:hypothetical protein